MECRVTMIIWPRISTMIIFGEAKYYHGSQNNCAFRKFGCLIVLALEKKKIKKGLFVCSVYMQPYEIAILTKSF